MMQTRNKPTKTQLAAWKRAQRALLTAKKALDAVGAPNENAFGKGCLEKLRVYIPETGDPVPTGAVLSVVEYDREGNRVEVPHDLVCNPFNFPSIMLGKMSEVIRDYIEHHEIWG